ncbi:hypothetical protein BT93_J0501 [Corymbia citriodora subsp. variegata]|nr:hypothetical protein BT93_J0501 [Corymbia citriodora subsp. variegata]
MEFWGVEVKAGQPLKVNPGNCKILHLSQASLGESKHSKGNETVPLHVKFGDQKLVLGTLSTENFPQLSFDLVFEKEFELSHNWKNGSVYFCGYQSVVQDEYPFVFSAAQSLHFAKFFHANAGKAESSGKQKASIPQPMKVDENDSDEDDDEDDDDDEDESDEEGGDSEADSDEEEDESDEEETPKKAEIGKKRAVDSATKTPVPAKKSKLPTPQKTDGKKGGHTATPHPAKQAGKNPANSANKTFNSEVGLQSHSKAKHGGK